MPNIEKKVMGRPRLASYRNKQYRLGRIEDEILNLIPSMKSAHDRELLMKLIDKLKS